MDENGDIGTQFKADGGELFAAEVELPQAVEANQGGRCVTATTAETAAEGQALVQLNIYAVGLPRFNLQRFGLQCFGRSINQIVLLGYSRMGRAEGNRRISAPLKVELVAVVEQLKQRL